MSTRRSRAGRVAAAAALAAVAAAAVWAGGAGGSTVPVTAAGQALPAAEFEPGLVHVHGLGVDPADGQLYAATHSGLFRVPETGPAERIANRYQDTMGFTVSGPGTFLGSGHPDPREDDVRPPLLGLVESTDRGRTWQRLSLHGEADFHALQAAHGRVYGYDATSGSFMVSRDERTWDARARLPLRDFAVSPADPDSVVGTTGDGPVRSADGGRSWAPLNAAPALVVLAWAAPDALHGVATDGTVHLSADGGATWQARGAVGGPPEALTVDARDADVLYVATPEQGILVSRDGGQTFTTRYAES